MKTPKSESQNLSAADGDSHRATPPRRQGQVASETSSDEHSPPPLNPEPHTRGQLSPEQHHILVEKGTEPPGSSPLNDEKREGVYHCAGCGAPLFDSATKYDSGSGWPSFTAPRESMTDAKIDKTLGMTRVEVHCKHCKGHLGHVFPDGPKPMGLRFCINGAALRFEAC